MTKIRSRILINSVGIICLFSISTVFTFFYNQKGIAIAESVQREDLPLEYRLEEVAISIGMIQRWLMDSALNGDSFGLDRADKVFSDIRQIMRNLESQSDETRNAKLKELMNLTEEMYEVGIDMAEAFTTGDEDEGYYLLDDFGYAAEKASDYVENLRSSAGDQVTLSIFEINKGLQLINRISLIAIIVSVVLSSLYTYFSTLSISRPIEGISLIALSMADGNLDQTIPESGFIEIRHLSAAINRLINSLSGVINNIQIVSLEVTSSKTREQEGLTVSTAEAQAAMTEIGSNLESIRSQTFSLEEMVKILTVSAQQISDTADSLECQVEQQVSVVTQSSASVEQMIRSIENITKTTHIRSESAKALGTVLETGREKLTASALTASRLSEYIEQMKSITKLITDVSEKSALLSMNAAIEAAHAGQEGSGFAVVAGEMRKLSEETSNNTTLIQNIINQAVAQIKELTDETLQATNAFNAIGDEVANVLAALLEISGTMEEMSAGSSEIALGVSNLTEVSTKVSEATENMKIVSKNVEKHVISTGGISTQVQQAVSEIGIGTQDVQERITSIFDRVRVVVDGIEKIYESVEYFSTKKEDV